jgi:hypothetical protein
MSSSLAINGTKQSGVLQFIPRQEILTWIGRVILSVGGRNIFLCVIGMTFLKRQIAVQGRAGNSEGIAMSTTAIDLSACIFWLFVLADHWPRWPSARPGVLVREQHLTQHLSFPERYPVTGDRSRMVGIEINKQNPTRKG